MGSLDRRDVLSLKPVEWDEVSESGLRPVLRVLVNSSTKALRREREVVELAAATLHLSAARLTTFGSQSCSQREAKCLIDQECDVYLGVLGERYGSKQADWDASMAFEIGTALRLNKPVLLYCKQAPDAETASEQRDFIRRIYSARLFDMLNSRFNEEELRTLCFRLEVDYDDLSGEGKTAKARELLLYLERRERVSDIVEAGKQMRPDVPWVGYHVRDFNALDVPDQLIEWVQQDICGLFEGVFQGQMPVPQPQPVPTSGRHVLIASLGRSPGAVTGLAHALAHTDSPVDCVRTVSTSEYQVQRAVRIVREDLQAQGVADYEDVCIGSASITGDRDARDFKVAFARLLVEAKRAGDRVAIGIAGGRTVMGALMALVAQVEAPPHSYFYQLSVPDDIEEDGRIPAFFHQPRQRQKELLRPMAYRFDQCHLVKVPFARFEFDEG